MFILNLKATDMSMQEYERMKSEWIKNNPNATPQQYQKAMMRIARNLGL